MKELFDGVKTFQARTHPRHRELYAELGRQQNPHTLFITCSDSRVLPQLLTHTEPGDLFVVRNIANVVPYYQKSPHHLSVSSAIEYALINLEVRNIVVCGHSDCGGCRALWMKDEELESLPHTGQWLKLLGKVKDRVRRRDVLEGERQGVTEQLNVVQQMHHLVTYPEVKRRLRQNDLHICGWHYNIATGAVLSYSPSSKSFQPIS